MKLEELHKQAESRRPEFKKSFGKDLVKGNYIALYLTVQLTGTAAWSITLTDSVNNFVFNNILSSYSNLP